MNFEWDEEKREINIRRHGIDFVSVISIFEDPNAIEAFDEEHSEEIEKMKDRTDYDRLKNMSEDEVRENAESDPDAPLQSDEDLKRFSRVKHPRVKRDEKSKD